jgi:hypothetical protein
MTTAILLLLFKKGYVEKLIERLDQAIDVLNNPKRLTKPPVSKRYYDKRSVTKTLCF